MLQGHSFFLFVVLKIIYQREEVGSRTVLPKKLAEMESVNIKQIATMSGWLGKLQADINILLQIYYDCKQGRKCYKNAYKIVHVEYWNFSVFFQYNQIFLFQNHPFFYTCSLLSCRCSQATPWWKTSLKPILTRSRGSTVTCVYSHQPLARWGKGSVVRIASTMRGKFFTFNKILRHLLHFLK